MDHFGQLQRMIESFENAVNFSRIGVKLLRMRSDFLGMPSEGKSGEDTDVRFCSGELHSKPF